MNNDRNRVMCPACGRPKMQFETERKAQDYVKWNADGQPLRVYYCKTCCRHQEPVHETEPEE